MAGDRNRDGEIVHQRAEGAALLVHVDENFADPAVRIFADVQIDLVVTDDRFLPIALAPMGQALALFDALNPLDDFFGDRRGTRWRALSHCQIEHVANLLARWTHAAATTSCHVCIADVLKARCVLADVR